MSLRSESSSRDPCRSAVCRKAHFSPALSGPGQLEEHRLLSVRGFTGNVQLERFVNGQLVEDVSVPGIWEMMYFGHVYR
jgi:hypothetical protein